MVHRFALPDLGEGVAEGTLLAWLVAPGDVVAVDQEIAEVGTDKVDVVIPSPVRGTVASLCVEPGATVPVGTVLAEIAVASETAAAPAASSSAVQAVAERLGVDLASLPPAPVTRGRRVTIARRLSESAAIPTVTNVAEADFGAVRDAGQRPLAAVAGAAVVALGEHPELNAWGRPDGSCDQRRGVDLGIATDAPGGLVVPVVRGADRLSPLELEAAIGAVSSAARQGSARPDQLRGSTFTITSAGKLSGQFATPLLNAPEVAILGLYCIEERPVVRDGAIVARAMGNLSVTFDHRAVDGLSAARFLSRVIDLIESWPARSRRCEAATGVI